MVGVVSYNTRDLTRQCLKAAESAAVTGTRFTLMDNGSTDGTEEAVRREHPAWEIVVASENPGYGAALNRAFRRASPRAYLALNSDILLHAETIRVLMDFLERHPDCGLVGPALCYPDGRPQPSAKRSPSLPFALAESLELHRLFPRNRSLRRFYYADQDLADRPWVDAVSGAAMLIRGEAFRDIGGFDEGFRMYFEETDLCLRLRAAGYRVAFCPQASAIHWHGASSIQTTVRQVEYYLSYVRFFRKHHGAAAARLLAAAVTLSTLARMVCLPFKYPPLTRQGLDLLGPRLAICRRLLGHLWHGETARTPAEARP